MTEEKQKIKVLKKDGSTENFDPDKITRVIKATGLDQEKANMLTAQVSQWIVSQKKPQITSDEIRGRVIEELERSNPFAANLYTWYKKNEHS